MKTEIKLTVELGEANAILDALSQLPYAQVSTIITKIITQGQEQMPKQEIVEPTVDTVEE